MGFNDLLNANILNTRNGDWKKKWKMFKRKIDVFMLEMT